MVAASVHPATAHWCPGFASSCRWLSMGRSKEVKVCLCPGWSHLLSGFDGPSPYASCCFLCFDLSCLYIWSRARPSCSPYSDINSASFCFRFRLAAWVADTSSSGFGLGPFRFGAAFVSKRHPFRPMAFLASAIPFVCSHCLDCSFRCSHALAAVSSSVLAVFFIFPIILDASASGYECRILLVVFAGTRPKYCHSGFHSLPCVSMFQ